MTPSHSFFQQYIVQVERINADEEHFLSVVGHESQEAIVSCLSLHWVNDLPGSRSSRFGIPFLGSYGVARSVSAGTGSITS
jgi:hypothetical protein